MSRGVTGEAGAIGLNDPAAALSAALGKIAGNELAIHVIGLPWQ
ncbi:MAG TPA: hypothetical protein VKV17_09055 [Bryobacteraceae bacterium]|nr:hypothetical protein [Bryobacteraceae bacterium]